MTHFPGIKVLNTGRNGRILRWTEPTTGKVKQASAERLGLTSKKALNEFLSALNDRLCEARRRKALGLPLLEEVQQAKPEPASQSHGEAVAAYLSLYDSAETIRSKRNAIRALDDLIPENLSDLDDAAVARARDEMARLGWAPQTLRYRRGQCAAYLRFCVERGFCSVSEGALRLLSRPDRTKTIRNEIHVMNPEQVRATRSWLVENEPEVIVAMFDAQILGGFRIGELLAYKPEWLMEDRVRIPAEITKTGVGRDIFFDVSPTLPEVLRKFEGQELYSRQALGRALARASKALGFKTGSTHALRKVHASTLLSAGLVTPLVAAKRLGHGLDVCEKHYASAYAPGLLAEGETVEAVLGL